MNIVQQIAVNSDCYKANKQITVKGIVIHSVGCPQPSAQVFADSWNKAGQKACVHAVADNNGLVIQCLPWNWRGWHVGGSANNTHIGVELTEPSTIKYTGGANWTELSDGKNTKAHVMGTYKTAVELFAFLCKEFKLNPLQDGVIISHHEAHLLGLGSNHGDVEHLWNKFGLSTQQFRKDIYEKMSELAHDNIEYINTQNNVVTTPKSDTDIIWNYLLNKIGNPIGVSGLMGNIQAESGFKSNNLQNTYNKSFGVDDDTYTQQIDTGVRSFIDSAGYGLCQWTSGGRKEGLYNLCKSRNVSISDLGTQLDWLWVELTNSYKGVLAVLQATKDIKEASDAVLTGFERPKNQSDEVKEYRAGLSRDIYNKYIAQIVNTQTQQTTPSTPTTIDPNSVKYVVRLSFEDKESQIGAYNLLNNAILKVEENTPYKIYNRQTGDLIYESCFAKMGRPKPFIVIAEREVITRVAPYGAEATTIKAGEYEVVMTYSKFGLILQRGWIDLADVKIKSETTEEEKPVEIENGVKYTDKNGTTVTFTQQEWDTLVKMWAYTGVAEEMISHHTVQELRTILLN